MCSTHYWFLIDLHGSVYSHSSEYIQFLQLQFLLGSRYIIQIIVLYSLYWFLIVLYRRVYYRYICDYIQLVHHLPIVNVSIVQGVVWFPQCRFDILLLLSTRAAFQSNTKLSNILISYLYNYHPSSIYYGGREDSTHIDLSRKHEQGGIIQYHYGFLVSGSKDALESAIRIAFRDVISDHSSPEINLIFQVIRLHYLAHGLNFDLQMPIVSTVQEFNTTVY